MKRYKRWIDYNLPLLGVLGADRLFLIDDGGIMVDDSFNLIREFLPVELSHIVNLYRFENTLGRKSLGNFPGWWRSFLFSIEIARKYGYKKMIHIESDFFVLSGKLKKFIRETNHGWSCLYSQFYGFPESGIQVICEDVYSEFDQLSLKMRSSGYSSEEYAESLIPFTNIKRNFIGDRMGELNVLAGWMNEKISLFSKLDYFGQINVYDQI